MSEAQQAVKDFLARIDTLKLKASKPISNRKAYDKTYYAKNKDRISAQSKARYQRINRDSTTRVQAIMDRGK